MEDPNFYEAERFLILGLYPQAFEAYMALEEGSKERNYFMPCQMALKNQLTPIQLDLLFHELELEVKNSNARVTYNYGLVMEHTGNQAKAIQLLQLAMDLGVSEARGALTRILIKGA